MMTQEKTNAFADEKQQQAWYAAEAGFKRAAVLLNKKEATWDWTTNNATDFKAGTFRKIDMQTLKTLDASTKDSTNNPWYAVNIDQITADSYTWSSNKTFIITSVGEYMGERKVIKNTITVASSSGNDTTDKASVLAGNNIIITGTNLSLSGNSTVKQGNIEKIVTGGALNGNKNINYYDASGKTITQQDVVQENTWNLAYGTLKAGLFDDLSKLVISSNYFSNTSTIVSTVPNPVTKNIHYKTDSTITSDITLASDTNAVIYSDTQGKFDAKYGNTQNEITVPSGSLLVLMNGGTFTFSGQKNVTNVTGDLVIISLTNVVIDKMNTGPNTRVYIIAGQQATISNSNVSKCFIAANTLVFSGEQNYFTGQFFSVGETQLGSGTTIIGDKSVLSYFGYPAEIMTKIDKT